MDILTIGIVFNFLFRLLRVDYYNPLVQGIIKAVDFPSLVISNSSILDCEQIALGTYYPLTGFMDKDTIKSVLNDYRLPSGDIWPMPILLSAKGIKLNQN